ncbi:MAG: hypothetical protein K6E50_14930 [Lachnospiraceae bacterium]|nr:hypothetical protein [Lachnospiraceae bacterium]
MGMLLLATAFLLCACGEEQARIDTPTVHVLNQDGTDVEKSAPVSAAGGESGHVVTLTPATGYEAPLIVEEKSVSGGKDRLDSLKKKKKEAGLDDASVKKCMEKQKGRYMYDMMDERLRPLYAEILLILNAHEKDILVSAEDAEDLQTAFLCLFQDHPELYWIDGYSYSRFGNAGNDLFFTFSGKYTYSAEECAKMKPQIENYVNLCLSGIPAGADTYDKVKHVYEYLIRTTEYQIGSIDNQNILSVFLHGQSVCQGYAKALQYLLEELDIPCTMVVGKVHGGEGHAWNLVNIDGAYYYVDATWGDAGYLSGTNSTKAGREEINYNYLNVTTEEISLTHDMDNVVPLPYCVAVEANYYVREGCCFTLYEPAVLRKLFADAAAFGEGHVSIKCIGEECYEMTKDYLLDNKEIFNLIPGNVSSVDYTTDDQLHILSFWF